MLRATTMNQPRPALRNWIMLFALRSGLCLGAMLTGDASGYGAAKPEIASRQLANGIGAVVVRFPQSTNVSIYTFSPLSLATDAAGQAQWAHLVEHMVIRTTVPAEANFANAETLPDHTRLDFYGSKSNWKEGLWHHRRWLEGIPFAQTNLDTEKPKVNQECDFTGHAFRQ